MELTKVQSSKVDAVGYLEQDGVLLVRFKDGTLYARTGVQASTYIQLLESPSKGSFLAQWNGKMVFLSKGGAHVAAGNAGNPGGTGAITTNTSPRLESGRTPTCAPPSNQRMTVNDMLKVKGGDPSTGCDFAVVRLK